jgi:hypothetical protein
MMPPLGLAAVPLPKKTLKIVPLAAAVAAAPVALTSVPSSRRDAASAVQASGINAGAAPLPPLARTLEPAPVTDVGIAEERAVALTGAAATAAPLRAAAVTAAEGVTVMMDGVELPSEKRDRPAAPEPRLERPGEVALVDDVEALPEA